MEAKRLSKDLISTLPSTLIENILCRLPIRDAVRTSILSRNWRYNWATIPKLVFNVSHMFKKSNEEHQPEKPPNGSKQLTRESKFFDDIHQILLLHQGPLLVFTLSMNSHNKSVEIDQIILHLSRKNTIKKLTLQFYFYWESSYKLPLSVLTFHQLTHLSLSNCEFDFTPFGGFGSLTSLSLFYVHICTKTLVHLISSCPLLEQLYLTTIVDDTEYHMDRGINLLDEYSDIWLEHLNELEIEDFNTLELVLEFVKLILAKSPVLKKVTIMLGDWIENDDELKISKILLRFPRTSPIAEIIVKRRN